MDFKKPYPSLQHTKHHDFGSNEYDLKTNKLIVSTVMVYSDQRLFFKRDVSPQKILNTNGHEACYINSSEQ